jgi:SAM-dependent methyltransferase
MNGARVKAALEFDPAWEQEIYARGAQLNRWPYDGVVSFLLREAPRGVAREHVRVLELGCGAGNNLWCAAREGFSAAGIDASASAIRVARERFAAEGLAVDLRVGDFGALPWEDARFELAFDRAALSCVAHAHAARALAELARVHKPGGLFWFNPYSTRHASAAGRDERTGLVHDIPCGALAGHGQIAFYTREEIERLLEPHYELRALQHVESEDALGGAHGRTAEWRALARRRVGAARG